LPLRSNEIRAGSRSPPYTLLKTFPAAPDSLVLGALDTITGCSECLPQEERRSGFFGLVLPEASHELYIVVAGIGRTEWRIERLRSCPNDLGGQRRELGWMVLGEVYAITIELFPIANLFCRGHRPRLDISSSNFPHFDVNPNSGEPEGEWQQPRIARNRVFAEAARSSHILLPIIPSGG
jgi:X-Pro dipeptidyl-peptidase C-terminal non-catalytic domain